MKLQEVLLVDDSDADLLFGQIVLERSGAADSVVSVGTGAEALDYLQHKHGARTDVILLDINMPEMSGFEFLEAYSHLQARHRARAVVVMLTSSPDPEDRRRAFSYGCVKGYVVKPLSLEDARSLDSFVSRVDDVGDEVT